MNLAGDDDSTRTRGGDGGGGGGKAAASTPALQSSTSLRHFLESAHLEGYEQCFEDFGVQKTADLDDIEDDDLSEGLKLPPLKIRQFKKAMKKRKDQQ